jgi:hypothetical protein
MNSIAPSFYQQAQQQQQWMIHSLGVKDFYALK